MLGHAPSKKEIPTLNQNDIPYESSTDKSNLFAENYYSSQFKIHKQQVENNDHNNITDHFNNNSNCYNDGVTWVFTSFVDWDYNRVFPIFWNFL
jgi:hypothetical protein